MARIYWGRSTSKLFYLRVCDSRDQKNYCVAKVLLSIWEIFLYENNPNYNANRFSYKFAFLPSLPFLAKQKQESNFQQVECVAMRNISVLCLKWVMLYIRVMSNSIESLKDFKEFSFMFFVFYYCSMVNKISHKNNFS